MASKTYTGVGSRNTPQHILVVMENIARVLSRKGYVLRSGGASGADSAFERGATAKEIYTVADCTPEALAIAERIHPAWNRCSDYAKRLHGRNVFQVLGKDINTPSDFLICWTLGAEDIGGTRTAIVLAKENNVITYNLGNPDTLSKWEKWLDKHV